MDEDYALGKMSIILGDNLVEGKIMQKGVALEKYEDAVARGDTAVMAEENANDPDTISIKVGNLLPG